MHKQFPNSLFFEYINRNSALGMITQIKPLYTKPINPSIDTKLHILALIPQTKNVINE